MFRTSRYARPVVSSSIMLWQAVHTSSRIYLSQISVGSNVTVMLFRPLRGCHSGRPRQRQPGNSRQCPDQLVPAQQWRLMSMLFQDVSDLQLQPNGNPHSRNHFIDQYRPRRQDTNHLTSTGLELHQCALCRWTRWCTDCTRVRGEVLGQTGEQWSERYGAYSK